MHLRRRIDNIRKINEIESMFCDQKSLEISKYLFL